MAPHFNAAILRRTIDYCIWGVAIVTAFGKYGLFDNKNPEEVNTAIVNGKQAKEYFHRVTGHAGHHLMDTTAKYYKVNLGGKVNNCLSRSLEKIIQKNIPKKNEAKSTNPGERMYLDISSMRKPSMGGRQHWEMLVDEATKYKKSFFLKKKNEQVEPIIDC